MNTKGWLKTVVRSFMCLFGIIGNNWLTFSSLPKSDSQLRTTELLFINLGISNLITSYMVDFPEILDFVSHFTDWNVYCGTFNFCSELSETSSIYTTMFITMYWHQKLVGSLKNGGAPVQMDNIKFVGIMLAGSWLISFAFSIPHYFLASVSDVSVNNSYQDCFAEFPSPQAQQSFDLSYLLLANLLPIIGIVSASVQIAVTLLQNEKRINANVKDPAPQHQPTEEGTQPNTVAPKTKAKPGSSSGNLVRAARSVLAVATVFLICWVIHFTVRIINMVTNSEMPMEIASYIGAIYTCTIPYIYLYGVRKLTCNCKV